MPLEKGTSRAVIERNIHEMVESGHPHNQAVAAALHTAHPGGGKDSYNSEKTSEAARGGQAMSHDEFARPVTDMTQAQINDKNKKYWGGTDGNVGPASSEASAPMLAGTKVVADARKVPVYDPHARDEVQPTQSNPPDTRSDNLLERGHGGIPGTEPLNADAAGDGDEFTEDEADSTNAERFERKMANPAKHPNAGPEHTEKVTNRLQGNYERHGMTGKSAGGSPELKKRPTYAGHDSPENLAEGSEAIPPPRDAEHQPHPGATSLVPSYGKAIQAEHEAKLKTPEGNAERLERNKNRLARETSVGSPRK